LCLHASIPASYSSSGIDIAKLSPLRTACGNCDEGISHKWVKACAKVLGWVLLEFDDVFACLGSDWTLRKPFLAWTVVDLFELRFWEVLGFEWDGAVFGGFTVESVSGGASMRQGQLTMDLTMMIGEEKGRRWWFGRLPRLEARLKKVVYEQWKNLSKNRQSIFIVLKKYVSIFFSRGWLNNMAIRFPSRKKNYN
jgi:hypothetical protein